MLNVSSQDCLAREGLLICHASTCSTCRHMPQVHCDLEVLRQAVRLLTEDGTKAVSGGTAAKAICSGQVSRWCQVIPGDARWCQVLCHCHVMLRHLRLSETVGWYLMSQAELWWFVGFCSLLSCTMLIVDRDFQTMLLIHDWKLKGTFWVGFSLISWCWLSHLVFWFGMGFVISCSVRFASAVRESPLPPSRNDGKAPTCEQETIYQPKIQQPPSMCCKSCKLRIPAFSNVKGRKETKQQDSLNPGQIGAGNIGQPGPVAWYLSILSEFTDSDSWQCRLPN